MSWILIQVAHVIFPYLGLPEWTVTLVIALAAVGFPVALVLAWAYDIEPEGVVRLSISHPTRQIELVSEGPVGGRWDTERLKQAITNLLTNAIHHGDDPIRIRLRGSSTLPGQASWQVLEVANRGGPIPDDDLAQLFEPFYRSWSARRRSQGLGLGLYIVREIAEAHGGRVEVESDEEETVFRMRLPRSVESHEVAPRISRIAATRSRRASGRT